MRPGQTPTVFTTLRLSPGQFGLFEELAAEALEVLNTQPAFFNCTVQGNKALVILDCTNLRVVMNWSEKSEGDVMTLAIGARPKQSLPEAEARLAADILREVLSLAQALFEAEPPLWQVTLLPLTAETIIKHNQQIGSADGKHAAGSQIGSSFMTIDTQPSMEQQKDSELQQQDVSARSQNTPATEQASWAMQTSALALSTTVMLVTPPVGVAMLAYTALRQGTEMDLLPRKLGLTSSGDGPEDDPFPLKAGSHA